MSREELICKYFKDGYKYEDIQKILLKNDHVISLGHLKVIIKKLGLKRKCIEEDITNITLAILEELRESGRCLGYKSLWQRLKSKYDLTVYRATVLDLLHILDPEGVHERARYGIKRREYVTLGPLFAIHLDGYDKLKFAGFSIHSCIDGFSRKLLWLDVATTNNKPEVIAYYYLKAINKLKRVPTLVRSDRGTENSLIELLQIAFRSNHEDALAGENSFVKGKSTANSKIESFWGIMRRRCVNFWINYFKDMVDQNVFSKQNPLELECLRFCFGPLLTYDLQLVRNEWNRHSIRKQKFGNTTGGKPNYLFYMPEEFGMIDCGHSVAQESIDRALSEYAKTPVYCSKDFNEMVKLLLPNLEFPTTVAGARSLYHQILEALDTLEAEE